MDMKQELIEQLTKKQAGFKKHYLKQKERLFQDAIEMLRITDIKTARDVINDRFEKEIRESNLAYSFAELQEGLDEVNKLFQRSINRMKREQNNG